MKKEKKWTSSLLAVSLIAGGILPYNVMAAEVKADSATPFVQSQPIKTAKISREEALRIAQTVISIPAGYRNDQVELENNKAIGRTLWHLSWNLGQPGDDYGHINILIDAQDGTILGMDRWSRDMERRNVLPGKIDTANLLTEAKAFVSKHYGAYANELKFDETSLDSFKRGVSGMENTLVFTRQHDGIPVFDQGVRFTYDKRGKLQRLEFNWHNKLQFENNKGIKSEAEILQSVERDLELELAYLPNGSRPGGKIALAYAPKLKTSNDTYSVIPNFIIDAKTGKQLSMVDGKELTSASGLKSVLSTSPTSPPANMHLNEAGAIEKVKELGLVDKSLEIQQRSYREETSPYERKIWELFWQSKDGSDKHIYVSLDAQTGELISLNRYDTRYGMKMEKPEQVKVNVTAQQAEKTAEAFVRKVLPGRLSNLYTMEASPNYFGTDTNKIMSYDVSFVRKENGIRVVGEGATVTVDAETGEIVNYNMNWSKSELPDIGTIISPEQAKKKIISLLKAELGYYTFPPFFSLSADQIRKAKPVYQISIKTKGQTDDAGLSYLDAKTGEWKSDGIQKINDSTQPVTDIAGHPLQKELQEMVDANLLEVKDGKVNPDQKLTRGELLKVFYIAARQPYDYYNPQQDSFFSDVKEESEYRQAAEWALQNRLLSREDKMLRPNEPATREFLAELIVRGLGYDKLAAKEGVFESKFKDEAAIQKRGNAALVTRLHIMEANSKGEFEPARQVTKAEAAVAIYRYLQTKELFAD
ncbi:S-layer homology domain-containing protein [Aneurinibacillus thermoaerophilus]|uniref:YcdB/YcdC domain-containing protein n=1 Tax=Aneurinibacillus thermoaerophilus TaxID=143495 RepID=UPI002E1B958D|nr:S-layer homology domain-containing protein [Aneurinibacillus thermoaerophilus]MED0764096.1 S-layer homology domain-containing protein [Aneurinibacillus thermoaerophilus]